jgi:glycosyltransferase involved in cell wall biosynthesis
MRILWVKANKILPVRSGGDIRSFNLVKQLAKRDELIFLSYYDGAADGEYEKQLQQYLPGAICVATGKRQDSVLARGVDYLLHSANAAPYSVSRFASGKVRQRLQECLDRESPDVVVCDFLDGAVNFPAELTVPSVLFQHNVESEIWRRHAETSTSLGKKQIYKREFAKMLRYERAMVRKFDHVIAVSEHDRSLMSAWVDASRIDVVPTGVDLEQYRFEENAQPARPLVVFVGAMDWEPNVDGVEHFCATVWPVITAQVPEAVFRIVGRNPGRRVQNLAGASVEVTGSVPSVIEHLREAAVVVVPLRIGGGTRLKIYEAMAARKAVVSTSVGAEGLDVHHGRNIILADSPDAFTSSILMLLRDADLRKRYERAAAELAARYDWPVVAKMFESVLEKVVASAHSAKPLTDRLTGVLNQQKGMC